MQRRLAHLGLVFLVLGAVALAAPTLGFSTIAADRGISASTAPDGQALLGVQSVADSVEGDGVELLVLTNNADQPLELTTNAHVAGTDRVQIASNGNGELLPGETASVTASCSGNGNPQGDGTLETDTSATGDSFSIDLSTVSRAITFDCRGGNGGPGSGDPANFVASDPTYDGAQWVQQFEVDVGALGPNDDLSIDLSDAQANSGVDYTSAGASIVSGPNDRSFGFDPQSSTIDFEPQGNPSGTLLVELSGLQLTSDQDGTASFSDSTGRSGSDTFDVPAIGNGNGETETDGDVVVEDDSSANDEIEAGGDVTVGDGSNTNGEIEAGGSIDAGDDVTFNQPLEAGGSVTVGDDSMVNGEIEAGGDVTIGEDSTVQNGEIEAEGDVVIGADSTVNGAIEAGGDVYLEDGTTVQNGDVDADGTVYEGCDVTADIEGTVEDTC